MPVLLAPPPVRVRPAPALDPPYDEDDPVAPEIAMRLAQPVLPLDWSRAPRPAHPRSGPPEPPCPEDATTSRANRPLPAGQAATVRFVNACVEVLGGYRPVAHLRQLITPAAFAAVAEQIGVARSRAQAAGSATPPGCQGPGRAGAEPAGIGRTGTGRDPVVRIEVRRVRFCEPRSGVVEAAAVLGQQDRRWAFAVRLERQPTGWRCTVARTV